MIENHMVLPYADDDLEMESEEDIAIRRGDLKAERVKAMRDILEDIGRTSCQ